MQKLACFWCLPRKLGSSPWVLHKQPTLHMGSHGHSVWMWICHSMTRLWRPWSQSHCTWPPTTRYKYPWYKYCQKSWKNLRVEEQSSHSSHLHGRRHVALDPSGLAMANININMPELSLQVSSTSKQWVPCNSMVIQSEYLAGWSFESEGPQQNFAARAPRLSLKHADLKGMEVRPCCPSQKPRPLPSAPVLATCQDDSCSNVQQQYYVDQSVVGARIRRVSQLCPAPTESEEMVASSSGRCDGQSLLCDANEFWMFLTLVLSFLRRMFAMVSDGDHFGLDILLVSCLFEYSDRAAVDGSAKSFIAAFFCITSLMILRSLYA